MPRGKLTTARSKRLHTALSKQKWQNSAAIGACMPCAVRAVVFLAKLLSEAPVESPEPVKKPLLRIFSCNIYHSHSPPLLALTSTIHHTTMNYPDTALADLPDFSLWPDASAVSEETAVWSQAAGYTQPGLAVENVPLDVLDADLAWGQSGVTHAGTFDFQTNFVSIFASVT